jgi:DNA modification methylase
MENASIDSAAWYIWHAHVRQPALQRAWEKAGGLSHQAIIWVKARKVLTYSDYMWQHEPCLYGWKSGHRPHKDRRPPVNQTTVWEIDQQGEVDGKHPTQKPVELFLRPLEYHSLPGEICYEPFSGSGTTLIAAERSSRRCFGIEVEPHFCDVILQRWERFTDRKAERINGEG